MTALLPKCGRGTPPMPPAIRKCQRRFITQRWLDEHVLASCDRYISSPLNPACSKCRSPVSPSSAITKKEMQSVSDHSLSGRAS